LELSQAAALSDFSNIWKDHRAMSQPATSTAPEPAKEETQTTVITQEAEPQNALTQKFTDTEWTALKEFRVLNSALSLSYVLRRDRHH
jgi:hypothetical protein